VKRLIAAGCLVGILTLLSLLGAGACATAIAGGEPSFAKASVGFVFVLLRMVNIAIVPPLIASGLLGILVEHRRVRASLRASLCASLCARG
jgi:hypothetical protein